MHIIEVDGYKAFYGTMRITPIPTSEVEPFEITGDWLYKPEHRCWYCQGRSFIKNICTIVGAEEGDING